LTYTERLSASETTASTNQAEQSTCTNLLRYVTQADVGKAE